MPLIDELKRRWGMGQPAQQPAAPVAPAQGLLGGGGVQGAMQAMQSRPYQLHVQEAKAMGQQPLSPEQFMQMQQAKPINSFW